MKYLWTEDTGAGLHFWELVNQLFFDDAFVIESKGSNPDVKCSHHEHSHGEGHTCGEHGCVSHSCH